MDNETNRLQGSNESVEPAPRIRFRETQNSEVVDVDVVVAAARWIKDTQSVPANRPLFQQNGRPSILHYRAVVKLSHPRGTKL